MTEYIVSVPKHSSEFIDRFSLDDASLMGYRLTGEIVRCKDCEHFTPKGTHKFDNGEVNDDYCKFMLGWLVKATPSGYCAWGERKETK